MPLQLMSVGKRDSLEKILGVEDAESCESLLWSNASNDSLPLRSEQEWKNMLLMPCTPSVRAPLQLQETWWKPIPTNRTPLAHNAEQEVEALRNERQRKANKEVQQRGVDKQDLKEAPDEEEMKKVPKWVAEENLRNIYEKHSEQLISDLKRAVKRNPGLINAAIQCERINPIWAPQVLEHYQGSIIEGNKNKEDEKEELALDKLNLVAAITSQDTVVMKFRDISNKDRICQLPGPPVKMGKALTTKVAGGLRDEIEAAKWVALAPVMLPRPARWISLLEKLPRGERYSGTMDGYTIVPVPGAKKPTCVPFVVCGDRKGILRDKCDARFVRHYGRELRRDAGRPSRAEIELGFRSTRFDLDATTWGIAEVPFVVGDAQRAEAWIMRSFSHHETTVDALLRSGEGDDAAAVPVLYDRLVALSERIKGVAAKLESPQTTASLVALISDVEKACNGVSRCLYVCDYALARGLMQAFAMTHSAEVQVLFAAAHPARQRIEGGAWEVIAAALSGEADLSSNDALRCQNIKKRGRDKVGIQCGKPIVWKPGCGIGAGELVTLCRECLEKRTRKDDDAQTRRVIDKLERNKKRPKLAETRVASAPFVTLREEGFVDLEIRTLRGNSPPPPMNLGPWAHGFHKRLRNYEKSDGSGGVVEGEEDLPYLESPLDVLMNRCCQRAVKDVFLPRYGHDWSRAVGAPFWGLHGDGLSDWPTVPPTGSSHPSSEWVDSVQTLAAGITASCEQMRTDVQRLREYERSACRRQRNNGLMGDIKALTESLGHLALDGSVKLGQGNHGTVYQLKNGRALKEQSPPPRMSFHKWQHYYRTYNLEGEMCAAASKGCFGPVVYEHYVRAVDHNEVILNRDVVCTFPLPHGYLEMQKYTYNGKTYLDKLLRDEAREAVAPLLEKIHAVIGRSLRKRLACFDMKLDNVLCDVDEHQHVTLLVLSDFDPKFCTYVPCRAPAHDDCPFDQGWLQWPGVEHWVEQIHFVTFHSIVSEVRSDFVHHRKAPPHCDVSPDLPDEPDWSRFAHALWTQVRFLGKEGTFGDFIVSRLTRDPEFDWIEVIQRNEVNIKWEDKPESELREGDIISNRSRHYYRVEKGEDKRLQVLVPLAHTYLGATRIELLNPEMKWRRLSFKHCFNGIVELVRELHTPK